MTSIHPIGPAGKEKTRDSAAPAWTFFPGLGITPSTMIHCNVRFPLRLLVMFAITAVSVAAPDRLSGSEPPGTARFGVTPPDLQYARAAALFEMGSDTLLYELNGDAPWAPASLTKLVTIYTALEASEDGRFLLDRSLPVHPSAYASAVPPGSSLMFLGPDQMVNGLDLLRGLAISSGNDASVEVALRVSGSVGAFNAEMNDLVRRLGFGEFYFEDPAGLSPANRITARGFARFSAQLLERWPWLPADLLGLPEFSYPRPVHYPTGMQGTPITQQNRNGLVTSYPGVDGLKTGFIDESGYNIAVTAVREGRRLIAVVLGVEGESHFAGGRRREADAAALLDWGFSSFETMTLPVPLPGEITLWGANRRTVRPVGESQVTVTVPAGRRAEIVGTLRQERDLWAPAGEGTAVGTVRYELDGQLLREVSLTLPADVDEGGILRRLFDRIRWWFRSRFGSATARESS
jgi:D-alanyl-D-alanine carboxypeptidase (penicillin-binding protein 5/6)